MPLSLDPNDTFPFVFSTDLGRANPPAILFAWLTCRQSTDLRKWLADADRAEQSLRDARREAHHAKTAEEREAAEARIDDVGDAQPLQMRLAGLRPHVRGWRGFAVPYDQATNGDLGEILSEADVDELASRLLGQMHAGEVEKKLCALSGPSATESSARHAEAAAKPAGPT
jgi:hypothetical protein